MSTQSSKNKLKNLENNEEKFHENNKISKIFKSSKYSSSKEKTNIKYMNLNKLKNLNLNINLLKNKNFNLNTIENKLNDKLSNSLIKSLSNCNSDSINIQKNLSKRAINDAKIFTYKHSQKRINQLLINDSPINNSTNSNNGNLNATLKNSKNSNYKNVPMTNSSQNIMKNNSKKKNYLNINEMYLSTEPENKDFFIPSPKDKNKNMNLKIPLILKNQLNKSNSKERIYIATKSNENNFQNYPPSNNQINSMTQKQLLFKKFKKFSAVFSANDKAKIYNNLNNSNLNSQKIDNDNNNNKNIINTNNRYNYSNSKKKSIEKNLTLNVSNSYKDMTKINSKNISMKPLETYSSSRDFIEDFFNELENYSINVNDIHTHSINRMNIGNFFDREFKMIITGEKPMESLDIEIKKKLSKYSEIWKKFLSFYEKMSMKLNVSEKSNYINNFDLSTNNVFNHNHNLNDICVNNSAEIDGKMKYLKLKKELEDKFAKLMKIEEIRIQEISKEKEKIIQDLRNQLNLKDLYLTEIQENMKNLKSKENLLSNSFLMCESIPDKKQEQIQFRVQLLNNFQNKNNRERPFSENTINNNYNLNFTSELTSPKLEERASPFGNDLMNSQSISKENYNMLNRQVSSEYLNEQNEILLYDQKQFIREKRLLVSENKSLFEKIGELEKLLNIHKEKEIKLMKVLFFLNKQGVPIDDIIKNQVIPDKTPRGEISQISINETNQSQNESFKSVESLMFYPITLSKPALFEKPQIIPNLDLKDINKKFNLEYETARKSNKVIINNNDSIKQTFTKFINDRNGEIKKENYQGHKNFQNNTPTDHFEKESDKKINLSSNKDLSDIQNFNNNLESIYKNLNINEGKEFDENVKK